MVTTMPLMLTRFKERVKKKSFLHMLTSGWERRVGIIIEDQNISFGMTFCGNEVDFHDWNGSTPSVDITLRGKESHMLHLFGGEILAYLHAKQFVQTKGSVRDQLKLDALLRLTAEQAI